MCHGSIILDMTNLQRLYNISNYNYHLLEYILGRTLTSETLHDSFSWKVDMVSSTN
jgi:hypothetical protein